MDSQALAKAAREAARPRFHGCRELKPKVAAHYPAQAAICEAQEEFGITPTRMELLRRAHGLGGVHGSPYVYLCTGYEAMAGKPACLGDEMSGPFWVEPDPEAAGLFPPFAESLRMLEARSPKLEALGTTGFGALQTGHGRDMIKAERDDAGSDDGIEWITANGARVPLRNGEPANDVGKKIFAEGGGSSGKPKPSSGGAAAGHPSASSSGAAQAANPGEAGHTASPGTVGSSPQGQERLEFTQEQLDNPWKDNPLTPEQVQTVRQLLREQFPGMETLPERSIQIQANRALSTGETTLQGVVDWLQEF